MKRNIVVAITGASGVTYSVRLLEVLLAAGCDIHLIISAAGRSVLEHELDLSVDLEKFNPAMLMLDSGETLRDLKLQLLRSQAGISRRFEQRAGRGHRRAGHLRYYHHQDYLAPLASGSFATDGMVVCPCSCNTLGAIAHGLDRQPDPPRRRSPPEGTPQADPRAARDAAFAAANREHEAGRRSGAVILPATPAFYHGVKLIGDLVDFVVARICDQLGIANALIQRWGESG